MPRQLAIEWDSREARVVVARTKGTDIALEQAFAIPLPQRDAAANVASGQAVSSGDPAIGAAISAALAARGLTRLETLVGVGRTSIELRVLTLPPAPPDELPDMVRFQATKSFTAAIDSWSLDFVQLEQEAESQTVLAAAISPEEVQQIKQTCATAQVEPRRLVLRPFAAASLWRRSAADSRCTLMVDPLNDEADLTVLVDGHVGFIRTVRLPSTDGDDYTRLLAGEIRRTIAAASNQMRGKRVERIVLCGDQAEHGALQKQLAAQTSLEVSCFDPLAAAPLTDEMRAARPARAGRFAPLIGMLLDEALGAAHGIDFLNPRKRPVPVSNRRRNLLMGAVAASVLLAILFWQWQSFGELDREIASLRQQANELDKTLKQLQPTLSEVEKIDEFVAGDVNWLDELYLLSQRFLTPDEAQATELNFNVPQQGGGQMLVEGAVRQANYLDQMERKLRDDRHRVFAPSKTFDMNSRSWKFKETVAIEIPTPEDRFLDRQATSEAKP